MTEETKNEKTPEQIAEQKALQKSIQGQLSTLTDEEKMLFKIYAGENQGAKMNIPEIRVNYDEDNGTRGGFILINYEEDETGNSKKIVTFLDTEVEVTILRTRFKYGYYDQDKGENGMELYGTPELDDYKGEVSLWDNENKRVIFTGEYKAFKNYIAETYPDPRLEAKGYSGSIIKHTEILYVELEGKIYRMYLSSSARKNYWEYKENIKGVPTFAFKTKLTTTKEKSGSITYFPIHFTKTAENPVKDYILMRKKLDEDLKVFDEVRNNLKKETDENTVKGKNPQEAIAEKYNLDIGENFSNPKCNKCGNITVLRDSFKGPFFGCSKYPECEGIVKLEDALGEKESMPVIDINENEENAEISQEPSSNQEKTKSAVNSESQDNNDKDPDDIDVKDIPF